MNQVPENMPSIGSALQAKEWVIEQLSLATAAFREAEQRRLELIGLASAFGLSTREIAKLSDEPPSSVASWARKVLAQHSDAS